MAILTSAGITFGDSTTQTTAAVAGVTSLNGQTGAITDTTSGNIGSYFLGGFNSQIAKGATTAGSGLRSQGNGSTTASPLAAQWPNASDTSNPSLTGTWRAMAGGGNPNSILGEAGWVGNLFVRVS